MYHHSANGTSDTKMWHSVTREHFSSASSIYKVLNPAPPNLSIYSQGRLHNREVSTLGDQALVVFLIKTCHFMEKSAAFVALPIPFR